MLYDIVSEIRKLTQNCLSDKKYDIDNLKGTIKRFSEHFGVFLEDETEQNFRIRFTKDPKDYFVDEIVETEPRIICFMDILGFSELINQYETEITSTVLQDIQESFEIAKKSLLENETPQNKEVVRHLKYQTFSDNVCISIPYFDNENDFLSNFNILITYIRGFQLIMMTKGFFTRGGISMGSYYADNNIIFSKGLVNAYHLESKKANYPRVILDNSIIDKLFSYNQERVKYFSIDTVIVFDWENTAFLNPFGLIESSISQIKSVFSELNVQAGEPFSETINTLSKTLEEMTIGLANDLLGKEKERLSPIKNIIINNLYIYHDNEHVRAKYLWLFEFIKWLEKDETGKLKFQFMTDILSKSQ